MDFTLYWFMLPVAFIIANLAMLTGIGGSALFTPIFLVVFPLLGPAYPLESAAAAIGASLLTATFGFFSGFLGYVRRGLIDFRAVPRFVWVGVPLAIAGAVAAQFLNSDALRGGYALLMVVLAIVMLRHRKPVVEEIEALAGSGAAAGRLRDTRRIVSRDGTVYTFPVPRQGRGAYATALGGFLTGLLSTGIGEVVMPQLLRANRVPFPVAAATSVVIVILVLLAASITQMTALALRGGVAAVPWDLVCYTIPGVLLGGQVAPRLQGRVSRRVMESAMGVTFLVIAVAMMWIAIR